VSSPRLVQAHRYVALGLGALIVVIGATGASLVFRDELTAWFTPAVRVAPGPPAAGWYERVLAAVRASEPQAKFIDIAPSRRDDHATEAIIRGPRGERHLFVDPHTGKVVADSDRQWLPFATFFQLHKRLMAGDPGEYLVAAAGTALAFLAVTGLIMWWPRKLKYAFRVRWSGNRLAVNFDLHRCAGAAFALFLLVNAITGVSMNLDEASKTLVNGVALSHGEPDPPPAMSNALAAMKPLDEIVAAAERAVPGGAVTRIAIRDGNVPVVVRNVLPGDNDTHGMNRIYVDAASATVLRASLLQRLPPGNAMFEWLYPLHTGKLLGTPYKVVLVLAGLVPLLSLVTGLIVWRSRAAPGRTAARNALRASHTA
jgi:uncharacterized iron-regulated membrane protein